MEKRTDQISDHILPSETEMEYQKRLDQENTFLLGFEIQGYPAFYTLTSRVFRLCYQIQQVNTQIVKLEAGIPDLHSFQIRALLREIKRSNEIEGIRCADKELLKNGIKSESDAVRAPFSGQVKAYMNLLDGKTKVPSKSREIRELYDSMLAEDIRAFCPENLPDGALFRKGSVGVFSYLGEIYSGIPQEKQIIQILDQSLLSLSEKILPVSASVFHFVFGFVHPFYDGNGRLARFISSVMLAKDFELVGVFQLSETILENREEYYRLFGLCESAENRGDLTPFLVFFLEMILQSFENAVELLQQKRDDWHMGLKWLERMRLKENDRRFLELMMKNSIFGYRFLSYEEISKRLDVSFSTARNLVRQYKPFLQVEKDNKTKLYSLRNDLLYSDERSIGKEN